MKMTPEFKKAQENMMPGAITATGFLGNDDRKIVDIIEHDEELIKSLNFDLDEALEKMRYLRLEGQKGLGEIITVDSIYEVRVDETRGVLPCPFEDGIFNKINTIVKNKKNGLELMYSDLALHLIEKHHFFQGKGSQFRIEPEILKKVLNL